MKTKNYIKDVLVTESRDFSQLKERLVQERNIRLLHGVLGLCTESAELFEMLEKKPLDLVNLKEEIGDAYWYIGIIIDELNFNSDIILQDSFLEEKVRDSEKLYQLNYHIDSLIKHVGLLQDLIKKAVFYGKSLALDKLENQLINISKELSTLCLIGNIKIEDCLSANISKLRARYGSKFTEEAAIKRDLDKERKILEEK